MQDETLLTPEERLQGYSDSLLSTVLGSDDVSKTMRHALFGQLPVKVFRDENYIIYKILFDFKENSITPDEAFLKMYLMRNTKLFKDSSQYIDLSAYSDLDENPNIGYISAVVNQFNRLKGMKPLNESDFKLTIEKYKVEYSAIEMSNAYSQARIILNDGIQVGKKLLQGFDSSYAYVKKVASDIENIMDNSLGERFIDSRTAGIIDNVTSKPEKISDFDLIDELNDPQSLGGIFTSLFYNVIAPTKGGKTKFVCRLLHTALVKYGINCSAWAFEGGHEAFWAQMRAIHFEYLYIRNAVDASMKVTPLSQKDILLNNYPSEEMRALEEASRLDFFTNPNYGVLHMINAPLLVETFIDDIDTSVKLNNSRLVVVDYLQLIGSSEKGKKTNEIVRDAYKKALPYCKERNIALITPAQFTQEFLKEMATTREGKEPEVRTAAGESSEVIRAVDINIALYASVEDLRRRSMKIMSIPSRLSVSFPPFDIYADLCSCVFSSIKD